MIAMLVSALAGARGAIAAPLSNIKATLERAYRTGEAWGAGLATGEVDATGADRAVAGQVTTMVSIITLGVLISVGILLYGEVSSALPSPESTELQNAQNQTDQQFADAMQLAPVIMFVLIVGVVIGVVRNL
jgi:hypothetical protein